jgi:hypothetical protein
VGCHKRKHVFFPHMVQQPLVGQGVLIIEASQSLSDTLQLVGHFWMSHKPNTETSIWQHTTFTRDTYLCPSQDWNPQFQQASSSAAHPHLRLHGHWDQQKEEHTFLKFPNKLPDPNIKVNRNKGSYYILAWRFLPNTLKQTLTWLSPA